MANEDKVHLIAPELYKKDVNQRTKEMIKDAEKAYQLDVAASDKKEQFCKWQFHQTGKQADKNAAEEEESKAAPTHKHILATL